MSEMSSEWYFETITGKWAIARVSADDSFEIVRNMIVGVGELTNEEIDDPSTRVSVRLYHWRDAFQ